jgi:hypothetical protein
MSMELLGMRLILLATCNNASFGLVILASANPTTDSPEYQHFLR